MKMLIRCKLTMNMRTMLIAIFKLIIIYELNAIEMKKLIDKQDSYRVPEEALSALKRAAEKVYKMGKAIVVQIKTLQEVHKQVKSSFVFKKKVSSTLSD